MDFTDFVNFSKLFCLKVQSHQIKATGENYSNPRPFRQLKNGGYLQKALKSLVIDITKSISKPPISANFNFYAKCLKVGKRGPEGDVP